MAIIGSYSTPMQRERRSRITGAKSLELTRKVKIKRGQLKERELNPLKRFGCCQKCHTKWKIREINNLESCPLRIPLRPISLTPPSSGLQRNCQVSTSCSTEQSTGQSKNDSECKQSRMGTVLVMFYAFCWC